MNDAAFQPSTGNPTRVSVIIPVHNVADHVAAAIASLRAQTLTEFEALVVDDGSTDGSGMVALRAIDGDPRFRLIVQANQGLSGARNTGIAEARGTWLAFLDGDDRFVPGFLSRMVTAAEGSGVDWAASAVLLCHPDGGQVPHSAIHGSPDPTGMALRLVPLDEARVVARHFPSAWNKVYRRSVFGDLRYSAGTWFEDHEVFWAFAARAPRLLHLPEPLVLHSRGRPGQITGADDDRVFNLFGVLDRLRPLVAGFVGADRGLAQLASRLIHERAQVVRDQARRARFLQAAADWLFANGLAYTVQDAPDLSRSLDLRLGGQVPLSVIVPVAPGAGRGHELRATLEGLRDSTPCDAEVVLTGPGACDVPSMPGLALRQWEPGGTALLGRFVKLLPPGAMANPAPLLEAALRHDAALALGSLYVGPHPHDGWLAAPTRPTPLPAEGALVTLAADSALGLHPSPARMVLRRDLFDAISPLSVPLWHPLAGAELVLRAALTAGSAAMIPQLVASEAGPHGLPAAPPAQAVAWAQALELTQATTLPGNWRLRLALRGVLGGLPPTRSLRGILARLRVAFVLRRRLGPEDAERAADLGTDRLICALLQIRPAEPHPDCTDA
jgi:hypothetical protein